MKLRDVRAETGIELRSRRRDQRDDVARKRRQLARQARPQRDSPVDAGTRGAEGQVSLGEMSRQAGDRSRAGVGLDAVDLHSLREVVPRRDQSLTEHEGRRRVHPFRASHPGEDPAPVVEAQSFAVGQDTQMRVRDEDLVAQIVLEAVHHAEDHDQRGDPDHHAADGDDGDQRQQARRPAAAQIPQGHAGLEARRPVGPHEYRDAGGQCQADGDEHHVAQVHSGLSIGKRITSRMFGWSVSTIISLSIPSPTPPVGGMPYSRARRKSSSS